MENSTDIAMDTAPAAPAAPAAAAIEPGDRMYELVYQGRTYCSPILSQIVKFLNSSMKDGSKRFYQPAMSAVAHGQRKSHHGATARICFKSKYMQAEDTIFIPALSRDQYVMRRRQDDHPSRPQSGRGPYWHQGMNKPVNQSCCSDWD